MGRGAPHVQPLGLHAVTGLGLLTKRRAQDFIKESAVPIVRVILVLGARSVRIH